MLELKQEYGWTKIHNINQWPKKLDILINKKCEAEYKGYTFCFKIIDRFFIISNNKKIFKFKVKYNNIDYIVTTNVIKSGHYYNLLKKMYNNKEIGEEWKKCCDNIKKAKRIKDYDILKNLFPIEEYKEIKNNIIYSNQRYYPTCPYCKNKSYKNYSIISLLAMRGFSCEKCSDGISYPNKFIRSLLDQLYISFIPEKTFGWAKDRRYDFYIYPNIIIEANGLQHYKNNKKLFKSFEIQKEIDIEKKQLALRNGIKYYIELDCSKSDMSYIKKSVLDSELPFILNFSENDIDWIKCEKDCCTSLILEVCNFYNNHKDYTSHQIGKEFNLNFTTIINYLNKGTIVGLCDYNPRKEMAKCARRNRKDLRYPFKCIENGMVFEGPHTAEVLSPKLFGKQLWFSVLRKHLAGISRYSNIGGYHFEYITKEEFNLSLINNPDITFGDRFITEE